MASLFYRLFFPNNEIASSFLLFRLITDILFICLKRFFGQNRISQLREEDFINLLKLEYM